MNPEATTRAAVGVVDTLLGAGVLGAVILVLVAFLAKLYVDKRVDDKAHAAALEAKDKDLLALAVKQAGTSAEQSMLMGKLIDRTQK